MLTESEMAFELISINVTSISIAWKRDAANETAGSHWSLVIVMSPIIGDITSIKRNSITRDTFSRKLSYLK